MLIYHCIQCVKFIDRKIQIHDQGQGISCQFASIQALVKHVYAQIMLKKTCLQS